MDSLNIFDFCRTPCFSLRTGPQEKNSPQVPGCSHCLESTRGLRTLTAPLLFLVDDTVSEEPPACPAALSSLKLGDSV